MRRSLALAIGAALAAGALALLLTRDDPEPRGGTLERPIRPRQQTALAFGERSHWLQPWRAYLDTFPATRLRDAIGIQFNVPPGDAAATAALLARSGFRRARVEFGWDSLTPAGRLRDRAGFTQTLGALSRHGIRPLILLNANHNAPGPTLRFRARLTAAAPAGAREVRLARPSARRVVPGRTGLDASSGKAADVLFTAVDPDGTARLSKPLPAALEAGPHPAATLHQEPFGPPTLADGRPNPRFQRTLEGWLAYARTIALETQAVLGGDEFDLEIWNEQTFGADFLHQERYYDPPRETGEGDVTDAILRATVQSLRALPGMEGVGIGNGFATQTPFPAGSTSPPGLTAIDKHPYYGIKRFPEDAVLTAAAPLDARGRPDFSESEEPGGEVVRRDRFIPRYDAFFPEYILTAIQTEHMVRDLSPITTDVNGTPHGRRTHPPGGAPPEVWITEANLDPTGADPSNPSAMGGGPVDLLTPADVEHLHAKAALRYYTAFAAKGVSAIHLFGVTGGNLALVKPGDPTGGETPRAVGRLSASLRRAVPMRRTQPLVLLAVSDDHGHVQFEGDGSRAHPPLFDRDVVAFFPFQLRPREYVAAAYVMTRNLARPYDDGSDPERYDLPEATFRLTIGGLDGPRLQASATDPLTGSSVPVEVASRERGRAILELELTDSPRLVTLRTTK